MQTWYHWSEEVKPLGNILNFDFFWGEALI